MAEIVVEIVKDTLLSLLTEEVRLLQGVHEEVEEIARELGSILYFLKDADERAEIEGDEVSDGVKSWVQKLRQLSFEAEDIVREYTHHMSQQLGQNDQRGLVECLRKIVCFLPFRLTRLKQRRDLAWQIESIKKKLVRLHERSKTYGFIQQFGSTSTAPQNVVSTYDPRRASRYLQEDDLVGVESARDELVDILLDSPSQRTIIPIVGMGGLGKTTLAQQLYNHVKGRFQCHSWVQVPQPYRREEILRTMIMELFASTKSPVPGEIHMMDEGKLTDQLREYLKNKKYLVIFDDVWNEDFWGDFEHVLVDDKAGARVMITTRNMQVAEFCGSLSSVHIHEMQCLPADKSWELFCKRTFRPEGYCPKELEKISGEIVERCDGLPLAIVVIAGLLSRKSKTINEWQKFHATLSSELEHNVQLQSITKILSLSYNDLPYYLKSCFMYFGMFPRRHSIRFGRLIRQWIAEGFIKAVEDKTLEEVAQDYMNELMNRSLVQATFLDATDKVIECWVHDLLHEIILKKTKEVSFFNVLPARTKLNFRNTRRLSIMVNSSNDDLHGIKFPHVHSVIVFREDKMLNSVVSVFATNFKFLKVLDFGDALHLDHLPEDIGKLFDLRYLSIRGTKVKTLPRSIKKLENLVTLDLRFSLVDEIPGGMVNRLFKLRYLHACKLDETNGQKSVDGAASGIIVHGGIGCLKALQKLCIIRVDGTKADILFKELGDLTQLRNLGIDNLRNEDGRKLCGCIEKMKRLESLKVASTSENEAIDLESLSLPPLFLDSLALRGRLKKLPTWLTQLQNLRKIIFASSMLEDDPLEVLENMHNLLELSISYDAYVGEQLCFKEGAFPKLKRLELFNLKRLHLLKIEKTALPILEELCIGRCPQMKEVPFGIQSLQNLKYLLFDLMPLEFIAFQDFLSVSHVPQVLFSCQDEQGQIMVFTLPDVIKKIQEMQSELVLR